jgi:nucleoside-diphosphate-sugar epimerase
VILVTGASGFLGSHVAQQLDAQGLATRLLVRSTSDTSRIAHLKHATLVAGDVRDAASLTQAVQGTTAVIHAAGLVKARDPMDFGRVNVDGLRSLLVAAASAEPPLRRVVVISSLAAHGPSFDGQPRPIDAPCQPVTAYGRSKRDAELVAGSFADRVPITVVRPPMIYGPADREVLPFFKAVDWGMVPLTGAPDSRLSAIYVEDCAAACICAVDATLPSLSTLFVDDGQPLTLRDRLADIEAALQRKVRISFRVPESLLRSLGYLSEQFGRFSGRSVMLTRDKVNELVAPHWVGDSRAAMNALSWQPQVGFAEGARKTVDWYRSAGWL